MKIYRIDIRGVGAGTVRASDRNQAYYKAFKNLRTAGLYDNYIKFKEDVTKLKVIEHEA